MKHIQDNQQEGSQLQDLVQVLPALSRDQVQSLLRELKAGGEIHYIGRTKAARWYPGAQAVGIAPNRKKKTQL